MEWGLGARPGVHAQAGEAEGRPTKRTTDGLLQEGAQSRPSFPK